MTKNVVSIDVGIRNLSFCFFESSPFRIIKWDNLDLTERDAQICSSVGCKKPVKFVKSDMCWCLQHSKLQPFIQPHKELTKTALTKTKVAGLVQLIEKYGIIDLVGKSRGDMVAGILQWAEAHCFESKTQVNAVHLNLVVIGRNIQHKLDAIFGFVSSGVVSSGVVSSGVVSSGVVSSGVVSSGVVSSGVEIHTVIIENQIGPLATKMKTVQGMLAQYFIMRNNDIRIEFVSSSNKLKGLAGGEETLDYKGRKKLGVECCAEQIVSSNNADEWLPFFKSSKKKDDLADCFLQGVWYNNCHVLK
jgi:hypothetical protein